MQEKILLKVGTKMIFKTLKNGQINWSKECICKQETRKILFSIQIWRVERFGKDLLVASHHGNTPKVSI